MDPRHAPVASLPHAVEDDGRHGALRPIANAEAGRWHMTASPFSNVSASGGVEFGSSIAGGTDIDNWRRQKMKPVILDLASDRRERRVSGIHSETSKTMHMTGRPPLRHGPHHAA
ncbi:hypothetical protein C1M53_07935 [Mesorhizobium sp. Pch-S]|nr:hypothetical protein C1M53_07935 [Mesorhizobium sp. Pch-S]